MKLQYKLAGKKFGKLTVVRKASEKNPYGAVLWVCKCDCGKSKKVTTANLNGGFTISCGCLRRERGDFVDLTGLRFGRLLVIKETDQDKHNRRVLWLCKCDCGVEKKILTGALKSGHTKSCGCLHREIAARQGAASALDLSGKRFGKLIAVEPVKKRTEQGLVQWRCKCDCGKEAKITASHLITGTKSCGCLCQAKETRIKRGKTISKALRKRYPKGHAGRTQLLISYKGGSRKRGIGWALSNEHFDKLTQGLCYYCGIPPMQFSKSVGEHGAYTHNGIDRVDNTKGYTVENCVTCCKICNTAKRDLTLTEFLDWVARISNHQRLQFLRSA